MTLDNTTVRRAYNQGVRQFHGGRFKHSESHEPPSDMFLFHHIWIRDLRFLAIGSVVLVEKRQPELWI